MQNKSLRINYGSIFELIQIFCNHPEEVAETDRLAALAQKKVDDIVMQMEILTARLVDEICKKRKVPASARQEVRRAEIQLDRTWIKKKKELNEAIEQASILQGRSKGLFVRGRLLEMIGKIELRTTFGYPTVKEEDADFRNLTDLTDNLELPEEE